jgi:hypothetical protein
MKWMMTVQTRPRTSVKEDISAVGKRFKINRNSDSERCCSELPRQVRRYQKSGGGSCVPESIKGKCAEGDVCRNQLKRRMDGTDNYFADRLVSLSNQLVFQAARLAPCSDTENHEHNRQI